MISPFFVGMVADRFFATERILALLHLAGGIGLVVTSTQTTFVPLYVLLLGYTLCYMPTLALTNSLSFRQMTDPSREFPGIRVLGTIGWIVAGLVIGTTGLEATALPMRLAAAGSIALGAFSLILPHTPPAKSGHRVTWSEVLGLEALKLMRDPSFAVFVIGSFLICIPLQFYYAFTNPYLNELGVTNAAGKMTMGQMSEIFFMLVMPWFFRKLGVKYMLLVGMAAALGLGVLTLARLIYQSRKLARTPAGVSLVGKVGAVAAALAPRGVVQIGDETWTAVSEDDSVIPVGEKVRVTRADGLILTVSRQRMKIPDSSK